MLDGAAGSGKTTLAGEVAAASGAPVVHLDDLYDGWTGLDRVADQLETLLRPLAAGRIGRYRRYDWHAEDYAETVAVPPAPLLVLEGVGAGAAAYADLATLLVWVSAPADLRLARGLARDGEAMRPHWEAWGTSEDRLHARERTQARADVVVDGTGAVPPVVRERRGDPS